MEKKLLSCEFNIDTACVEVKYANGSKIYINCIRAENEATRNMCEYVNWPEWCKTPQSPM